MLTLDMVIKVIICLIILTSSVLAKCKDYSNLSNDLVKNVQVEVYKEKKFIKHISKFYLSMKKGEPPTNYNKKKNTMHVLPLIMMVVITVLMKLN